MHRIIRDMSKFYAAVAISAVKEFWTATDDVLGGIAVLSFFAILLSRKYGDKLVTAWNGVSPWWSLVPIGLLVVYRLLRANYEKFVALENRLAKQATADEVKQQIKLLTVLIDRGREFMRLCRGSKDLVEHEQVNIWETEASELIATIFDSTYISRFESSVGIPMGAAYWPNLENRHVDGYVLVRVYRLQEFVDELRKRLGSR